MCKCRDVGAWLEWSRGSKNPRVRGRREGRVVRDEVKCVMDVESGGI